MLFILIFHHCLVEHFNVNIHMISFLNVPDYYFVQMEKSCWFSDSKWRPWPRKSWRQPLSTMACRPHLQMPGRMAEKCKKERLFLWNIHIYFSRMRFLYSFRHSFILYRNIIKQLQTLEPIILVYFDKKKLSIMNSVKCYKLVGIERVD